MYSVQQLQALDYLLKRITNNESYALYQRNLKLVIEYKNSFWYGDFVQLKGNGATQIFISDDGHIERDAYYPNGSNAIAVLKEIWDAYVSMAVREQNFYWRDPFTQMDNLPLLFETLIKILESTNITGDSSPFHPYLLNACSLNSKIKLPFINLSNERINLISIIEIEK